MSLRSTRSLFILLLAFAVLAAACGGSAGGDESAASEAAALDEAPVVNNLQDGEAVRVGVLAIRSAVAASAQYGPIVEYLEAETGRPFVLVPLTQQEQFDLVETGDLDFVLSNPLASVQLQRMHDTEFLATLSRIGTGTDFAGLIISKAGSGIVEVDDVVGQRVACVGFQTAAAGCNFQVMHLRNAGIMPEDFASFTEIPSQDNIVLAVLNGTEDVGFIRSGQLEKMLAEGTLISLDEIQIVDQATSDFALNHTTILYPEWPMASLASTDPELAAEVTTALQSMTPDNPALESVNGEGFAPPADYSELDALVVALELRSWDS